MDKLEEVEIRCPYCGESIGVMVDCSVEEQSYIEDCQVCCRPMELTVVVDGEGEVRVSVRGEEE